MTLALETRATHWPHRTAIRDATTGTALSYAELDERATAAAARLDHLGVGEADAVVVLSRNRPLHVELLFGVQRIGATLAPVSHRLSASDVSALLDRIGPAVVVHEDRFAELVPSAATTTTIDEFRSLSTAETAEIDRQEPAERDPVTGEDPLLYLHTGGTTGVPKVVVVTARQVEWNCITEVAAWGLGRDDVSPLLLPLFHTGGWHLLTLPTLYVGGTVVLRREFDPGRWLALIEEHGATHVFGVAAMFDAMAEHPSFEEADLTTVEWFMSGGGPTPRRVFDAFRDRGHAFTQGYGLTEGGPNNLYMSPDRPAAADKPDSVGQPFPDFEIRIVDDGEPVSRGETGELELRGPVAADAYLAVTDGTFAGEWTSTGDLARRDADGNVYITGRVDNMFVSGGENVYPEEIEDVLERHPDVEGVGVVGIDHDRWGTVPKAVVVGTVDREALIEYASAELAGYKQPHEYEFVAALPTSGPGKLDREALDTEYGGADA